MNSLVHQLSGYGLRMGIFSLLIACAILVDCALFRRITLEASFPAKQWYPPEGPYMALLAVTSNTVPLIAT